MPSYVVLSLQGELVELPQPKPDIPFGSLLSRFVPIPSGPPSAHALRIVLERLAADSRVKGIVLKIGCETSPAVYQGLRAAIQTFRASGKRVVAYAEQFGPFQYYLACACDHILMPPTAEWTVLGFAGEYVFFKDALERIGVGVDVVNVSPFKSAGDQFARNDFSEQSRAQAEWLLDARYDALVRGIADGRALSPERVRELIDSAPYDAPQAAAHGLIDAALYEDELERWLEPAAVVAPARKPLRDAAFKLIEKLSPEMAKQARDAAQPSSAAWISWADADKAVPLLNHDWHAKRIGVVAVQGLITRGPSRGSPLPLPFIGGSATAGSASVTQALRRAEKDDHIAAVILFVDSSGGDALASDLIARELQRLNAKKPVVALMSGVAASGGYYVAALARHIIAQPLTITGSIGVISMKPHTQGLYERLSLHRSTLTRGANAAVFTDLEPLDARSRAVFERTIGRVYADFKRVVATGRKLPDDGALEDICGGRVWTGAQARERGLVDEMGGFPDAMRKAAELAAIHMPGKRVGWQLISPPRQGVLPPAFVAANPASWLAAGEHLRALLRDTRAWALAPWSIDKTR